jgi:saccharopine dehydrogenase (NAD+, L-lysine forming)
MRKPLTVGILQETKNKWERRVPLVPEDVRWLVKRGIEVEVASSALRAFKDALYRRAGARVVPKLKKASFILGVKEPQFEDLRLKHVYLVFSHTTKGQIHNRPLLKTCLKKKITLIDYEHVVDYAKERLVYFGRFAGICGMIDSLHYLGKRFEAQGYSTPLSQVRSALDYGTLEKARRHFRFVAKEMKRKGFPLKFAPFVVGITGHGNVAQGALEILSLLRPIEIHPRQMREFVRHQKKKTKQIYTIVFDREEKLRAKSGKGFYFEDYLDHPEDFESNLDCYLPHINLLINSSYWDKRYPRLVPEKMIIKLSRAKKLRLQFIGDLTCDVKGTIEITRKTTTPGNPTFVFNPKTRTIRDGYSGEGVAVLAIDHLPCEMPEDASREFSAQIRDYVYQIASHGASDITRHAALPREVREAVICQGGKLAPKYAYLKKYL